MKKLDLEAMGVAELSDTDKKATDAGSPLLWLLKYYPWDDADYMRAHNKALLMK